MSVGEAEVVGDLGVKEAVVERVVQLEGKRL